MQFFRHFIFFFVCSVLHLHMSTGQTYTILCSMYIVHVKCTYDYSIGTVRHI